MAFEVACGAIERTKGRHLTDFGHALGGCELAVLERSYWLDATFSIYGCALSIGGTFFGAMGAASAATLECLAMATQLTRRSLFCRRHESMDIGSISRNACG